MVSVCRSGKIFSVIFLLFSDKSLSDDSVTKIKIILSAKLKSFICLAVIAVITVSSEGKTVQTCSKGPSSVNSNRLLFLVSSNVLFTAYTSKIVTKFWFTNNKVVRLVADTHELQVLSDPRSGLPLITNQPSQLACNAPIAQRQNCFKTLILSDSDIH